MTVPRKVRTTASKTVAQARASQKPKESTLKVSVAKSVRYAISIDPGVEGTGYAVWATGPYWRVLLPPEETGILTAKAADGLDWQARTISIIRQYDALLKRVKPTKVYCEYPSFFEGTAKGSVAAKDGSLVKLSVFVGCIMWATVANQVGYEAVPVNVWKGQLTKAVVAMRVAKLLDVPIKYYPSHSMDAVGVGLHVKGHFKPNARY